MRTEGVAETYARVLLELASLSDAVVEADDALKLVVKAIRGHVDLRDALKSATVPAAKKREIMRELFAESVTPPALAIATVAVEQGHAELLEAIASAFSTLVETELGVLRADVVTAVPLNDALRATLAKKLSAQLGKRVVLRDTVDPAILGGIVINVAGRVLDGSLLRQLDGMRSALTTAPMGGGA